MSWRLLDTGVRCAPWNMAVDEALLLSCDEQARVTLRFYRWEHPTLSLGYFQGLSEINLEECARRGFAWIRRPTGGRAVLHQHELTYSFVSPIALLGESVSRSHEQISQALALGLRSLGLCVEFAKQREHERELSAVCFAAPALVELTLQNKKIIGSAQVRTKKSLLQHGSIPITIDFSALAAVLGLHRPLALQLLSRRAAGLASFLGREPTPEEVRKAMIAGFEKCFAQQFSPGRLTLEEQRLAEELCQKKYMTRAWNWGLREGTSNA